jgi:Beta-propeller repeat
MLAYSTYLGGSDSEHALGIAVDAAGSAYLTGDTGSADFPTVPGALDTSYNGTGDAFVTKLAPNGASLVYSTYLGGRGADGGLGIAVDGAGSAYLTGYTGSADFPTTPGALDTSFNGFDDAFVTKLASNGAKLLYSTYLGGSDGNDIGYGIAIGAADSAYVTGYTSSANFPTTPGAFDTSLNSFDAFVTKLAPDGRSLAYSTYLGGSATDLGFGIAVDAARSAYVTGETVSLDFPTTPGAFGSSLDLAQDAFVTKLAPNGASLVYSSYLGGSSYDNGVGVAVDAAGSAYLTGQTQSVDFPTTPGAFDTSADGADEFVTKLAPDGASLVYSTYLGGGGGEYSFGIAVDGAGSAYVTGQTSSDNFPTTPGALSSSLDGPTDAFATKLVPSGASLAYSTYLGGSSFDGGGGAIAVDAAGSAYVTGQTQSVDFPTTPGAFDTSLNGCCDAFVTKLELPAPAVTVLIDIKPGSDTNPINLRSKGVIPVAILSTQSFDATTVDPASVCYGDAEDASQRDCTEAHAKGHLEDVNGDGRLDLLLHFETQQTGIDPGDTMACLTGKTFAGVSVEGCDSITIV